MLGKRKKARSDFIKNTMGTGQPTKFFIGARVKEGGVYTLFFFTLKHILNNSVYSVPIIICRVSSATQILKF